MPTQWNTQVIAVAPRLRASSLKLANRHRQEEHRQTHGGVHRRKPQERGQILRRDSAVPHVIAQPQRQKVGGIHRQRVVQEQAQ